jgi:predicted anti-sigma-YlaC factor YlaD
VDRVKLTFAVWVVIVSFLVVVGLTITQFVTQKTLDSVPLDSAVDWAKSIATIALGFALGRSIEESKSEKSAD